MRIPSVLYGNQKTIVSRVRKFARALVKSDRIEDYDLGPSLDTRETPGLILLYEEFEPTGEHFHTYALSEELVEACVRPEQRGLLNKWLMASLDDEARFICTLTGLSPSCLVRGDREGARRYVEAAIRFWPALVQERDRFGPRQVDFNLIDRMLTLSYALEQLGLPAVDRMQIPNRDPQTLLNAVLQRVSTQ